MNYFKAAEQVLSSVPALKMALENLERRKQQLIESGAPQVHAGIDYSKPFTDSHYVNNTLNEVLKVSECTKNIAETKRELNQIDAVLAQLSGEYKKIIVLWYIEKKSKEFILETLHIESLTTVYNMRNKAVAEFAILYYGASALPSI